MTTPIHEIEVKVNLPCCSVCDTKMNYIHEGWENSNSKHSNKALYAVTIPCPLAALHGQIGMKMATSYETKTDENGFVIKTIVTLDFSEPEVKDLSEDLVKTYDLVKIYRERRLEFEIRGKRKSEDIDPNSPIEPFYESLSPTDLIEARVRITHLNFTHRTIFTITTHT